MMEVSPVASTSRLPEESATVDSQRQTSELSIDDQAGNNETPVVRGRGRGRPRGSKARGRGRPRGRGKGLPKLNWQRPRPGDSSDDEVQFLAQHTVHPEKATARGSEPLAGGSDGAAPNSDAVPDVAAVSGKRSRSGRTLVKPVKIVPSTEPSFHRVGLRRTRSERQTTDVDDSSLCSICLQGHSAPANLLVTCDVCDTPYHQLCHTPAISDDVATSTASTWFCSQCEPKRGISTIPAKWEDRVPGQGLPERDKLEYLQKLPHASLVNLLLDIESHMQDARLYPPNLAAILSDYRRVMAAEHEQISARQTALDSLLDEESRKQDNDASKRPREASKTRKQAESPNKRIRPNPANQDLISGLAHLPDVSASANPYSDPTRQPSAEQPRQSSSEAVSMDLLDPELRSLSSKDAPSAEAPTSLASHGARTATNYEEMAVEALEYINDPHGTPPRMLFQWIYDTYPVADTFRGSAGQALSKAVQRGRLLKDGILYKINPHFDSSVLSRQQKKPTRPPRMSTVRQAPGSKPREEYATPPELRGPSKTADGSDNKDQGGPLPEAADQFDMLDEEDEFLNTDQLETDFEEDEDGDVDIPDFTIHQQSESQNADMDSFLAEFMSASNGDTSVPAPGHELDHLLDPSLFGPDSFQSAFYHGMDPLQ